MVIMRIRNVAYTVSVTLPCGACYFRGGETAGGRKPQFAKSSPLSVLRAGREGYGVGAREYGKLR